MARFYRALLATIILSACTGSDVVGPNAGDPSTIRQLTPVAGANGSLRPIGGTCTLVSRTVLSPTRRILEWECQLEHLGRTTALHDETGTAGQNGVATIVATTTYTAANGDQLFVSHTATAVREGGVAYFNGSDTVTGGTGRFAGATGTLDRAGSALLPPGFGGQYETRGTISY